VPATVFGGALVDNGAGFDLTESSGGKREQRRCHLKGI